MSEWKRGARASRARWLASRQTRLRAMPLAPSRKSWNAVNLGQSRPAHRLVCRSRCGEVGSRCGKGGSQSVAASRSEKIVNKAGRHRPFVASWRCSFTHRKKRKPKRDGWDLDRQPLVAMSMEAGLAAPKPRKLFSRMPSGFGTKAGQTPSNRVKPVSWVKQAVRTYASH
jgi:hypothetical protein